MPPPQKSHSLDGLPALFIGKFAWNLAKQLCAMDGTKPLNRRRSGFMS
jgi:hypothetical protein